MEYCGKRTQTLFKCIHNTNLMHHGMGHSPQTHGRKKLYLTFTYPSFPKYLKKTEKIISIQEKKRSKNNEFPKKMRI